MAEGEGLIKKILRSKVTMFLLLLGFVWLSVNVVGLYYKKYKINKEIADLKAQISDLDKNNQEISQMIDYLGSQSFLEKEAKEKLNMKKEGEQVVAIEPAKENVMTSTEAVSQLQAQQSNQNAIAEVKNKPAESNIVKWWKYFFK